MKFLILFAIIAVIVCAAFGHHHEDHHEENAECIACFQSDDPNSCIEAACGINKDEYREE